MKNVIALVLLFVLASCNVKLGSDPSPKNNQNPNPNLTNTERLAIAPNSIYVQTIVDKPVALSVYIQNKTSQVISGMTASMGTNFPEIDLVYNECLTAILSPQQSCRLDFEMNSSVPVTRTTTLTVSASSFTSTADFVFKALPDTQALITNNAFQFVNQGSVLSDDLNNYVASGNASSFTVVSQPANGVLSVNSVTGFLSYTPNVNYSGTDSFTFKANNSQGSSNVSTYQIYVQDIASPPTAYDSSVAVNKNTSKSVVLIAQDDDNRPLSYSIVSQPAHGTLSGSGPNRTYTPAMNYTGTDSFTFKVSNGSFNSNVATISLTISDNNQAPIALNSNVNVNHNTATNFVLVSTDPEGATLTYSIVNQPVNGTLSGSGANLTYTPNNGYSGSDSLTFRANDGSLNSNTATVSFSVSTPGGSNGPNVAPIAQSQSVATQEDTALNVLLVATDANSNSLTYTVVSQPAHGTLSGSGQNLVYTPALNYTGADSFTFKANDGLLDSNIATVTISVSPVNDAPVASNSSISTNKNVAANGTLQATDVDSPTLTYSIVAQPLHGVVSVSGAGFTYTPTTGYFGSDSFTFRAYDGSLYSNIGTVSVSVQNTNAAPVANNASFTLENTSTVNIMLQATDADGNALTYTVVSQPAHGTLSGSAPNLVFTPTAGYTGADSFTFKANDGTLDSNIATISLTIAPSTLNQAPIAQNQSVTTPEDTAKTFTLAASDPNNNPLTVIVTQAPAHGSVTFNGIVASYTPALNYNGADSFSYQVNDGLLTSNIATVSIVVTPVNDGPQLMAASYSTNEDVPLIDFIVPASDPENDVLTYTIVSTTSNGTLVYNNTTKKFTYTPNLNYNGVDSFVATVSDGQITSSPMTYNITVNPLNDAPIANNQSVTTPEDVPKAIVLGAADPEGSVLTYTIVSQPTNGTLSGSGANRTYTPNANFNGTDSFSFKVNDGSLDSNTATVSISVTPVNDAPVAFAQSYVTQLNQSVNMTLVGQDVEGSPLTYSIVSQPAHGTLSGTAPNLTYTPNLLYSGVDSFTFKVNDGQLDSNVATISINVNFVNLPPVAVAQVVSVVEDTPKQITLVGTDPNNDTLTYIIVSQPTHGTLSGSGANVTYTPASNYNGADSFIFKVNDGTTDSLPALVTISVTPVNDAPVAFPQTLAVTEDTSTAVILQAMDQEGNVLTYTLVSQPTHGTLSGSGANYTYTPALNYNGSDSFTFKVNDGQLDSNVATVTLNISGVNDAPIAMNQSQTLAEDTSKAITLVGTDADGNTLSYIIVSQPAHGTITGTPPALTYTPALNYNGSDSFTFKVNDGQVDSNVATVSLSITPVNDAPVANNMSITTSEDVAYNGMLQGLDPDANTLTYTIVGTPSHGTVTIINFQTGAFVYTPAANYNGSDSFSYKVNDGTLDSNIGMVSINVTPVNDAPLANNLSFSTNKNTAYSGQVTGSDIENSPLTYSVVTNPAHGTVILNASSGSFTYNPTNGYVGSDSFTFKVNDGTLNSNNATVSITVIQQNQPPVAQNLNLTAYLDQTTVSGQTVATDADNNPLTYSMVGSNSNVSFNSDGSFTYTNSNSSLPANFALNHQITSDWGPGYAYQIQFTNNGSTAIQNWTLCFTYDQNVGNDGISNADIHSSSSKPNWKLVPKSFNQIVYPAQTVSINWNASPGNLNGSTISNIRLYPQADANCGSSVGASSVAFNYKANDGQADSNTATVTINFVMRDNNLKIETNPSLVPHSLNDYPLLIDLQTIANQDHFWDNVQANGGDIVMTLSDKVTKVPMDLRNFNKTARTGQLWFKSNIIQNVKNAFYLHYNNTATAAVALAAKSSQFGAYNVWKGQYVGVWDMHFNGTTIEDATEYQHHITKVGSPISVENSYIDRGLGVNLDCTNKSLLQLNANALDISANVNVLPNFISSCSTNEMMTRANTTALQLDNEVTISSWVYPTRKDSYTIILRKESSGGKHNYALKLNNLKPHFTFDHNSSAKTIESSTALPMEQWSFVVGTFNATTKKSRLYVNGVMVKEGSASTENLASISTSPIEIGGTTGGGSSYSGVLDEVKLSHKSLSAEWLLTEYNMTNQANTFWLVYDENVSFSDSFNRADSNSVGNSWTELEGCTAPNGLSINLLGSIGVNLNLFSNGCGYIRTHDNQMEFYDLDNPRGYPEVKHSWPNITSGKVYMSFYVDFFRESSENDYSVVMNFGENTKSVGELIWGSPSMGLASHGGFGVVNKATSTTSQLKKVYHRELVIVDIDYTTKKYNLYLKGSRLMNIPFIDNNVILNKLSIITNEIQSCNVPRIFIDNVVIKQK